MQKSNFPCWLSPKDKAIAHALISVGFWYCGLAEDFVLFEETLIKHHGWLIGGAYQEQVIDAVCDGALFCLDVQDCREAESEFLKTKLAISRAVEEWKKPIGEQLRLPI